MIVRFFNRGEGAGRGPVRYCVGEKDFEGEAREVAPVVLRGDPDGTERLIDSLDFKFKYTSGVLAFAEGETITPEMERRIMDGFEEAAFAGLDASRYAILWVRHAHAGKHEMHFVIPRVELDTGKSLNVRPPGKKSERLFDAFRNVVNAEYGLSDPDDPARAKGLSLPDNIAKLKGDRTAAEAKEAARRAITEYVRAAVDRGEAQSRDDVEQILKKAGFEIPRAGKNYLTVKDPKRGDSHRMKGPLFDREKFDAGSVAPAVDHGKPDPQRAEALKKRLDQMTGERATYHLSRYGETDSAARERVPEDASPEQIAAAFERAAAESYGEEITQTDRNHEQRQHGEGGPDRLGATQAANPLGARIARTVERFRAALGRFDRACGELGKGFAEKIAHVRRRSFMDFARKWGISPPRKPPDKGRGFEMG